MKQDGAKNFTFELVTDWRGYNSSRDKTNISEKFLVEGSKNVYKKLSGNIAVRPGQKRLGDANSTLSAISSEFVWNTSWGATYTMVISNSNLYVVIDNVWYSLLSGLTKTRYVFDKWWNNTEKKDRLLFVNGTDDMFHWSGGFATISSTTATTITKTGSTSWQQAGFSTTSGEKTVVINGTTYTYTGGETTTTLTGVTPDPTGEANGSTVLQAVQTASNKPAADFLADFIKVINNQVYVGSYTSRLCYISSSTDFTNYTVPTPRVAGSPELLTLDGTLKGIGVRQGKAHIGFGSGSWAVITFVDITVGTDLTQQTVVDVKPVSLLQAPYAHEFIDTVGDSLIYLAQDQQVRSFGDFNNLFTTGFPSLSQEIATELMGEDFAGGSLRCIGEFVYVCAPNSGTTYLYQVRYSVDEGGNVVAERLWHAPFIWNVTSVNEVNGVVVGFSNSNPQIYQLWDTDQWFDDSPSDEELPYECVVAFPYNTINRSGLLVFDKVFTEGYITEGSIVNQTVNYDFEGSTNSVMVPINTISNPAYTFGSNSPLSLGDSSLGEESLGQSIDEESTNLRKFRVINSVADTNCFEYQTIIYSNSANAQWEILSHGTNVSATDKEQPNYIINKIR